MRTLYLDLGMGAAGDMLTAALLELVDDKAAFVEKLNGLGIPSVTYKTETVSKCGINGTHMHVFIDGQEEESDTHHHEHEHEHGHHHEHGYEHEHEHHHEHEHSHTHHHTSMHDIEHIVMDHLDIPDNVKNDVISVYNLIASAESAAHGKPVSEIHFHEVGTMDAVADVTAVCMLINELKPEKIIASPVHVGSGHVHCAHGILPVPAPATAYILKDVPMYGGNIKGELCTPTGAALIKHFVTEFAEMPTMKVSAIGYGMGKKDFEMANCVRVMLGETDNETDDILELSCNVDDMTGEKIGFAMDKLFEEGALDVFITPVYMKKSRPGHKISVICREESKEKLITAIFKNTTTLGIRENKTKRYVLDREINSFESTYGTVHKKSSTGYGVTKEKLEYDDLSKIAKEKDLSLYDVESVVSKDIH